MKFMHFRNKKKCLLATIAYQFEPTIDAQGQSLDTTYYGISVVSRKEPNCKINYFNGRRIAHSRCENAVTKKIEIPWGIYKWHLPETMFYYDTHFEAIKLAKLQKLGSMPTDKFIDIVAKLKKLIEEEL